jgi:hypothetical protein
MEIISRDEAIARGLKRFFTGQPCKHGHVTERFVKGWLCYGCTDANAKAWAKANKQKKQATDASYREANRQRLRASANARYAESEQYRKAQKERALRWNATNPIRAAQSVKAWERKNPEAAKERKRKWRVANPGITNFWTAMRRARIRNATPPWADAAKIQAVYETAAKLSEITGIPHEVDHIVPLKGKMVSGLHVHYNLQILPRRDNRVKGNKHQTVEER